MNLSRYAPPLRVVGMRGARTTAPMSPAPLRHVERSRDMTYLYHVPLDYARGDMVGRATLSCPLPRRGCPAGAGVGMPDCRPTHKTRHSDAALFAAEESHRFSKKSFLTRQWRPPAICGRAPLTVRNDVQKSRGGLIRHVAPPAHPIRHPVPPAAMNAIEGRHEP